MLMGDKSSARWIAIVGGFVALSACAACLLLTILLTSTYGGETVRLRNPFAAPTLVVVDNGSSNNGSNNSSGGTVNNGTGNNNNNSSGGTVNNGGATGGNTTSGGNSVPSDTLAASYLPSLSGYTTANASSITDAFELISGSGVFGAQSADGSDTTFSAQSLSLSTLATTVLVARLDEFIACYQRTGAVDARIYIRPDVATLLDGGVPPMGAVVVANQDRLVDSLVSCAVSPNDPGAFSAQSANQPCGNFGSFTAGGDRFTYVYAGTTADFCTAIEAHFGGFTG
jgi:hypothetical protein